MTRYAINDNNMRRVSVGEFDTMTEAVLFAESRGMDSYTVVPVSQGSKRLAVHHVNGDPNDNSLTNCHIVDISENRR
jgi:hypothetical protein